MSWHGDHSRNHPSNYYHPPSNVRHSSYGGDHEQENRGRRPREVSRDRRRRESNSEGSREGSRDRERRHGSEDGWPRESRNPHFSGPRRTQTDLSGRSGSHNRSHSTEPSLANYPGVPTHMLDRSTMMFGGPYAEHAFAEDSQIATGREGYREAAITGAPDLATQAMNAGASAGVNVGGEVSNAFRQGMIMNANHKRGKGFKKALQASRTEEDVQRDRRWEDGAFAGEDTGSMAPTFQPAPLDQDQLSRVTIEEQRVRRPKAPEGQKRDWVKQGLLGHRDNSRR